MKHNPKANNYIQNERGFTLIRCTRCGDFYDKHGVRHVCKEKNSMTFGGKLIEDDEGARAWKK